MCLNIEEVSNLGLHGTKRIVYLRPKSKFIDDPLDRVGLHGYYYFAGTI